MSQGSQPSPQKCPTLGTPSQTCSTCTRLHHHRCPPAGWKRGETSPRRACMGQLHCGGRGRCEDISPSCPSPGHLLSQHHAPASIPASVQHHMPCCQDSRDSMAKSIRAPKTRTRKLHPFRCGLTPPEILPQYSPCPHYPSSPLSGVSQLIPNTVETIMSPQSPPIPSLPTLLPWHLSERHIHLCAKGIQSGNSHCECC